MMPAKRIRTSATVTDIPATEISIADVVEQLGITEQALRLALIDIRPDDFDTTKTLPLLDFEAVAKKIETIKQPQLPLEFRLKAI